MSKQGLIVNSISKDTRSCEARESGGRGKPSVSSPGTSLEGAEYPVLGPSVLRNIPGER